VGQSGSIAASSPLQLNPNVSGSTAVSSVVNFLETVSPEFDVPFLLRFGHKAPFIPVKVENVTLPFLLDTGASVSVLPKDKVLSFLSDDILTYAADDYSPSRTITAFGGGSVTVEGPFRFTIELLNLKFTHKFFLLDAATPFIAGFDLIVQAGLIIDPVRKLAWSMLTGAESEAPTVEHQSSASSLTSNNEGPKPSAESYQDTRPSVSVDTLPSSLSLSTSTFSPDTQLSSTCVDQTSDVTSASDTRISFAECNIPDHLSVLFLSTVEEATLPSDVAEDFRRLLVNHVDTFAKSSDDIGFCPLIEHDIDTGDSKPIRQPPRRPPLASGAAEDELIDEMLQAGVIEPSNSAWASPVCLVRKPDGKYRFCVDYRRVNAISKQDAFPIPDIRDALDSLRGSHYYATIDLLSGYWQLGMSQRAKERSAFCTRRGLFQFNRMPFGLSGAPASFCRLMHQVLRDHLWRICLFYLDDIIIFAETQRELLERLDVVLSRLNEVNLKVKPSKCSLFKTQIAFLGHMVCAEGVNPLPDKIKAIQEWPTPKCIRDFRAFFGLASYYRRFVRNFAAIAEPLSRLTRTGVTFSWSSEAQAAFDHLKTELLDTVTLAYPVPGEPFILDTDASDVACGAVLSQVVDGVERPVAFFSRVLNSAQRNYCPTRRELLAVIAALQNFRHYLLGTQVILRTDHHSLKWLCTFKRPEGILARWMETLAEFHYTVQHRPGRLHSNADAVSRPFCKQCHNKPTHIPWIDELERADSITAPWSVTALEIQPEMSHEEIQQMQDDDPALGPVKNMIAVGDAPTRDELRKLPLEARRLWSQRPLVKLRDGLLVKTDKDTTQLVVPYALRERLMSHTHAGPLSAHLGAERTLIQLRQLYYWPGTSTDVQNFCRICTDCATSKGPPTHPHGKLVKVATGAPMDIVAIDILSGLPVSHEGHKYLLVATDYFTKWLECYPLSDAEASTCMTALYNGFFARFGLPSQLHSDRGTFFESKLVEELCRITGVTKSRTTPFHPRSDGQTERANRTILQMLRSSIQDNPKDWPNRLPALLAAYRMTPHSVTGITPNMAMLGREVLLPTSLIARPPEELVKVTVPYVDRFRHTIRQAHNRVRTATQRAAKTEKTYFDRFVKGTPFALGQLVYLYWPRPLVRQQLRKLTRVWTGPWKIIEFKTSVVVVIQNLKTKKRQTVHIDRLVPCNNPAQFQDTNVVGSEVQSETTPVLQEDHVTRPIRRSSRAKKTPARFTDYVPHQ